MKNIFFFIEITLEIKKKYICMLTSRYVKKINKKTNLAVFLHHFIIAIFWL